MKAQEFVTEKWSQKYKNSINCSHPKGFSQRAHCAGKKKHNEDVTMEQVCPDCGMCQTHGNLNEIKKGQKDANGYTRCWPGKHAEGTKRGKNGGLVRNCVPNESVEEALSRKDLLKQVGDKLNDPEFRKQPADPNIRWEKGDLYKGPGPDDYGYTGYQGHGMPRDKPKKKKGVAEGHADQQRKVFKKNGEPVGEVGIDRESSPGVGQYYMKHYASGKDLAGYDSYEEAVAELKHCMKQGVAEGEGRVDPILIKALNRMPDGLATHREVLDAAYDAYAMELGKMAMRSEYGVTNRYIPQLLNLYKDRHGLTFNEDQDLLKNTYTVVFVDPNTGPKVLGKFNSVAEAKKLIRNSFDDMYDTGDHLRNVAPGIYVLEEDYRNTGERATANNYKHFYHWIIQPSQGVKEDTELAEEFDLIELIIEDLAASNGVDSEVIWEDLESLDDDELYVFATTSTIMETEAWQKANNRDRTNGMSRKAVKAYRREHPGSKLQTAVTTKPSKLKKGSKASKRRKSYCSRSKGQMKMHNISCAKTPDKAICKARRRWNC